MKCEIEVRDALPYGVHIWCATCCESVSWDESFTLDEVNATALGHFKVMAKARAASKKSLDNRTTSE